MSSMLKQTPFSKWKRKSLDCFNVLRGFPVSSEHINIKDTAVERCRPSPFELNIVNVYAEVSFVVM